MSTAEHQTVKRGLNYITKGKYTMFDQAVHDVLLSLQLSDDAHSNAHTNILNALCNITNFDPHTSTYNRQRVARLQEASGKSTYQLLNKAFYTNNKEHIANRKKEKRQQDA
jgi:hypothetical protein